MGYEACERAAKKLEEAAKELKDLKLYLKKIDDKVKP